MRFLTSFLFAQQVAAHGYISIPQAQFKDGSTKTKYNSLVDESIDSAFAGLKWNDSPDNNLITFTNAFKKTKFTSLKDMFDLAKVDCGNSRIDIAPIDVSNMNSMSWQNDEYKEGFIKSHSGPCEVWLDGKMVSQNDDCRSKYSNYPAVIPIDYSSCQGECLLEFFWCAVHEKNWQLYKQCVPIVNSNSSKSPPASNNIVEYSIKVSNGNCECSIV